MTKIKNGSKTEIFDGPGVSSKVGDITYWTSRSGGTLAVYPDAVYLIDAFGTNGRLEFKIFTPRYFEDLKHVYCIMQTEAEWDAVKWELIKQIMGV